MKVSGQFNEVLRVLKILIEMSRNCDRDRFPKIALPISRHVSSIKEERVFSQKLARVGSSRSGNRNAKFFINFTFL